MRTISPYRSRRSRPGQHRFRNVRTSLANVRSSGSNVRTHSRLRPAPVLRAARPDSPPPKRVKRLAALAPGMTDMRFAARRSVAHAGFGMPAPFLTPHGQKPLRLPVPASFPARLTRHRNLPPKSLLGSLHRDNFGRRMSAFNDPQPPRRDAHVLRQERQHRPVLTSLSSCEAGAATSKNRERHCAPVFCRFPYPYAPHIRRIRLQCGGLQNDPAPSESAGPLSPRREL